MDAIEAEGLKKVFGGEVEAVAGIDLAVHEGEVFGFLGPNGAGKSTTTRMLTTLLRPTAGTGRVAGLDILRQGKQVRRVIGVALQDAGLDYLATGRDLLELQGRLHGLHGRIVRDRAGAMLELVGLKDAALRAIAEIVHDIDLKDEKFVREETPGVLAVMQGLALTMSDDVDRIARGSLVLDGLYSQLQRGR